MALIQCDFHSDVLGKACAMNVILPQKVNTQIGMASSGGVRGGFPVLYLLHGLSDNHTIWCRRTSIERYVAQYNLAVVMPDGGRSFYTDMTTGEKYWTFLSEELPQIVQTLFPVTDDPAKTYAAGLSMGGYGALKLGLRCPEKFAGVASLSAVTDVVTRLNAGTWGEEFKRIFGLCGEDVIARRNDLFALADECAKKGKFPRIYSACGTEDYLHADNLRLRDHLTSQLNWPDYCYEEGPGSHCWEFWDLYIQNALRFLLKA